MNRFRTHQGRDALYLILSTLDNSKQYIILQAFTCIAVPQAIISAGFKPLWCDIEEESLSIDCTKLQFLVASHLGQVAGILLQHTFGHMPTDYYSIRSIANEFQIPLIEDCAHKNPLDYPSFIDSQVTISNSISYAYFYSFESGKPIKLGSGGLALIPSLKDNQLTNLRILHDSFRHLSLLLSIKLLFVSLVFIASKKLGFYWYFRSLFDWLRKRSFLPLTNEYKFLPLFPQRMGFFQSVILTSLYLARHLGLPFKSRPYTYIKTADPVLSLAHFKARNNFASIMYTSPVQPLSTNNLDQVYYQLNCCPLAEKLSGHIIIYEA